MIRRTNTAPLHDNTHSCNYFFPSPFPFTTHLTIHSTHTFPSSPEPKVKRQLTHLNHPYSLLFQMQINWETLGTKIGYKNYVKVCILSF